MIEIKECFKKPRVSRAVRWDGRDFKGLMSFCRGSVEIVDGIRAVVTQFDGRRFELKCGDYVVEKSEGRFFCMKKVDFENNYEEAKYGC